jgi:hypothetical protein
MPGSRALGLLLEDDVEKLPCLVPLLIGLWVQRVGDVLQPAGGGHHVVGRSGEAQGAGSPYAGVVIIDRWLHNLLPRKKLPLAFELCLGGL